MTIIFGDKARSKSLMILDSYDPATGTITFYKETKKMGFLKGIDYNRLGAKLVRDFVMIFAASAVWQVENPGIEGILAAAVSCAGIAAYRVGRDLIDAYKADGVATGPLAPL